MRISTENEDETHKNHENESTYTVEQAVENAGFGFFQIKIIIITGVLAACDAMEMLLLSVLGPELKCEWLLSSGEVASLTTAVFIGFLFSAPIWGYFSDRFGRKTTYVVVLSLIAYFGILTSFAPTFPWLILLRTVIGIAIGGAATSSTLLTEYLPAKYRARVLLGMQFFWAIGAVFEVCVACLILPTYSWRLFIVISSLPMLFSLFSLRWLPESSRFLAASNRFIDAEQVILELNYNNKVKPLPGRLVQPVSVQAPGSFSSLFAKDYLVTTLFLPIIWFATAFNYYGVVLLSSSLMSSRPGCYSNKILSEDSLDNSCCHKLTNTDFVQMIISTLGEFPAIPLSIIVVEYLGRRRSISLLLTLEGIFFGLLMICMSSIPTTAVLLVIRCLAAGHFSISYTYTLECYPTKIRSLALGLFSSCGRIGAILTPFFAQVILPDINVFFAISFYVAVCLIGAVTSFFLPIETSGRALPQSVDEVEIIYDCLKEESFFSKSLIEKTLSPSNDSEGIELHQDSVKSS